MPNPVARTSKPGRRRNLPSSVSEWAHARRTQDERQRPRAVPSRPSRRSPRRQPGRRTANRFARLVRVRTRWSRAVQHRSRSGEAHGAGGRGRGHLVRPSARSTRMRTSPWRARSRSKRRGSSSALESPRGTSAPKGVRRTCSRQLRNRSCSCASPRAAGSRRISPGSRCLHPDLSHEATILLAKIGGRHERHDVVAVIEASDAPIGDHSSPRIGRPPGNRGGFPVRVVLSRPHP